ncbi:MAG: hypothetical protein DWI54_00860 [Chloroflexi bacterium]|nr:MAG: hypothetical protein DWI54_00860 [Chloroflexota bacterium]
MWIPADSGKFLLIVTFNVRITLLYLKCFTVMVLLFLRMRYSGKAAEIRKMHFSTNFQVQYLKGLIWC